MRKVILSDKMILRGNEGSEIFTFDMMYFLSTKTVEDLTTVLENAIQGNKPATRYML